MPGGYCSSPVPRSLTRAACTSRSASRRVVSSRADSISVRRRASSPSPVVIARSSLVTHDSQARLKRAHGHVLGCPLFTLGAEVSTEEPKVRAAVAALLGDTVRYFESAIREAQASRDLPAGDAAVRARCLHAFLAGALTQARIANNPALLRDLPAQATAWLRTPVEAKHRSSSGR